MNKPIQLEIEEAKKKIISVINDICNENNIDYYFLESIINELHNEVKIKKELELRELEIKTNDTEGDKQCKK